ncbi:MAG TPA: patatin-like phospholipase family protein [Acetobacteraceae bacterium]|jgi:NTE family protein|nr:patatin-like phospholipase family protein [Acetobacteraceae bacterium]
MTKSCATKKTAERGPGQGVALALQGGGAHGAFTWGVLDRLLEEGLRMDAICGVSSGALIGAMLVQGWVRDGADGARAEMAELWRRVTRAHAMSPLQSAPLERWLWGWDTSNSLIWRSLEMTMRMFSPAQLNPFGHHPLRALLADMLDPALLTDPAAPRLIVAATDVETGEATLFENAAITVEVLLASSCLPFVFPAVEIDGRGYWDGGYAGNPPLGPLLHPAPPGELLLVRAQPASRAGVPTTPLEIMNRLNEIACQNVLAAELAALPHGINLTSYDADDALLDLPIASKFNGEEEFLSLLFRAGRTAGALHGLPERARQPAGTLARSAATVVTQQ